MRKTFVKKGLRELWKHKYQYAFLIVILGLGVGMYSAIYDMGDSREVTLEAIYDESLFMDVQVKSQYGETVNITTMDEILSTSGLAEKIEQIEYRLSFDVFINHTTDKGVRTTRGIVLGLTAFDSSGQPREQTVNKPLFYVDDPSTFTSQNARECYLERKFAKAYELDSGDQLTVIRGPQKVQVDILEQVSIPDYFFVIPEGSLFPSERSLGVVVLPLELAFELYFGNSTGDIEVNDMVMLLNDPDEMDEFKDTITKEFEEIGVVVKVIEKEENAARRFLYDDLENDKESMNIFPVIIFMVTGFGLVMVLRRMIRVHRAQIGIFKALGIPDRVVLLYFALIGLFIGIFGIIAGFLFAIPINGAFNGLLNDLYDFPIMKLAVSWEYYVYAGIISIILCLICTVVPTWRGLRIKPIDAIQNREGISSRRVGKVAGKVGRTSRLPVPLKLTLRNLIRKPGRTTTSIFGVALSLALFLSFAILLDTVAVALERSAEESNWDYEVLMDGFAPVNITAQWSSDYTEIETVNHGIFLPTKINSGKGTHDGMIYALEDVEAAYKVELERGKLKDGQLIISSYLSDKLDVDSGDTIELEVPKLGPQGFAMGKVNVTISGVHSNHIGFYIFTDLATIQQLTNLNGLANIIYLNTVTGDSSQALENTLITTPGVSAVTYTKDRINLLEQYFEIFVGTVFLIALMSMGLAAAIIYNLFMISAQENKRNYATMKTLGTSLRRLGYLIFIEAAFITLFGVLLGIAGGYVLAYGMMATASEFEVWNFELVFSWLWFAVGTIMIVIVIVLVSWLTIRYIKKINIADVIRERSY
ncbi:ABC transporter permease [[Eubacterium] cellulosolvens]